MRTRILFLFILCIHFHKIIVSAYSLNEVRYFRFLKSNVFKSGMILLIIIQEKSGNEKRLREDVKTTTIKKHDFMLLQVLCFLEVEFKHLLEYNDV